MNFLCFCKTFLRLVFQYCFLYTVTYLLIICEYCLKFFGYTPRLINLSILMQTIYVNTLKYYLFKICKDEIIFKIIYTIHIVNFEQKIISILCIDLVYVVHFSRFLAFISGIQN